MQRGGLLWLVGAFRAYGETGSETGKYRGSAGMIGENVMSKLIARIVVYWLSLACAAASAGAQTVTYIHTDALGSVVAESVVLLVGVRGRDLNFAGMSRVGNDNDGLELSDHRG